MAEEGREMSQDPKNFPEATAKLFDLLFARVKKLEARGKPPSTDDLQPKPRSGPRRGLVLMSENTHEIARGVFGTHRNDFLVWGRRRQSQA